MSTRHPIQPLYVDATGKLRFRHNAIVYFLLEAGPFNMNMLMDMDFPQEDKEQFAQLLGYDLVWYGELPYVSEDTYQVAVEMAAQHHKEDISWQR